MTVSGRSKDTTKAIADSKALLGVESLNKWRKEYTPKFVDFPFTKPGATFEDHLDVVRSVKPKLTVAPDIEKGRDPEEVYAQADKLNRHADAVVVVPKEVPPEHVPDRFRVGLPAADYGSDAPWLLWQYRAAEPVHVLGGGPATQLQVAEYVEVASVDTATLGKAARFGWYKDGYRDDAPDRWDYKTRLEYSLTNYVRQWSKQLHTNNS